MSNGILVLCEHSGGAFKKTAFELLGKAVELAGGAPVMAAVIGGGADASTLGAYGASKAFVAAGGELDPSTLAPTPARCRRSSPRPRRPWSSRRPARTPTRPAPARGPPRPGHGYGVHRPAQRRRRRGRSPSAQRGQGLRRRADLVQPGALQRPPQLLQHPRRWRGRCGGGLGRGEPRGWRSLRQGDRPRREQLERGRPHRGRPHRLGWALGEERRQLRLAHPAARRQHRRDPGREPGLCGRATPRTVTRSARPARWSTRRCTWRWASRGPSSTSRGWTSRSSSRSTPTRTPIFQHATYGIVADMFQVGPSLKAEFEKALSRGLEAPGLLSPPTPRHAWCGVVA